MAQFAGYGFNKSHSAAYALLAYHTAYLKTHYPVEFMAALLTSVTGNTDDVVKYINECREMGIAVEPPDINVSRRQLHAARRGDPLRAGGGEERGRTTRSSRSSRRATKLGRFRSIYEFCEEVDLRLLNKRVLESLIKSGAMDSLGRRAQLMAVLDKAMDRAQKDAARCGVGPARACSASFSRKKLRRQQERLPERSRLGRARAPGSEKEILGFFITGHPLEKYQATSWKTCSALSHRRDLRP